MAPPPPTIKSVTTATPPLCDYAAGTRLLFFGDTQDGDTIALKEEHQQLKEKVRNMLVEAPHISSKKLDLINNIQRLGVNYHFKDEIEAIMQHIFEVYDDLNDKDIKENDLYAVSIRFRLLRQEGYGVSSSCFAKFLESDGKLKESLLKNVDAILSLYEASHLRVHGEKILDEMLIFTTSHLRTTMQQLRPNTTTPTSRSLLLSEALKQPICKRLARIDARIFLSIYQLDESHDTTLLKFAKLDFNLLQKQHQKELGSLTRWWKNVGVAEKLPFARDRLVECYLWSLGVYFEPQYSLAREFVTKMISLASVVDDVYDVHGTPEELQLFTHAFQRLDASAMGELPAYMKVVYNAFLDVFGEMEIELAARGESYRIHYAKAEMKKLVEAYYKEGTWFHGGSTPTFDEYMKVALKSSGYFMAATASLVGMPEDFVASNAFDWLETHDPLIVQASAIIARLKDDIAGHKFEQERGHMDSAVECYMKQYGKLEEEAVKELEEVVANAWKDINQECLKPTAIYPLPILIRVVNLARVIELLYKKDGDSYTHSSNLKPMITSILVDPVL